MSYLTECCTAGNIKCVQNQNEHSTPYPTCKIRHDVIAYFRRDTIKGACSIWNRGKNMHFRVIRSEAQSTLGDITSNLEIVLIRVQCEAVQHFAMHFLNLKLQLLPVLNYLSCIFYWHWFWWNRMCLLWVTLKLFFF